MGFTEFLTIVFVVLKLIGVISWSWWLVLLPEIIGVAFYILIMIAGMMSASRMNRQFDRMVTKERKRRNRF
jgi:ABC-type bacteriocin/lantibiotic exporter with double-glycine peptidase domain